MPFVCLSLLLGMWLHRRGRGKVTEAELREGQYKTRKGPNKRKVPLTATKSHWRNYLEKERKEQNIPHLIGVALI